MPNKLANGQSKDGNSGAYSLYGKDLEFDPSKESAWRDAEIDYQSPDMPGNVGTFTFNNKNSFDITLDVHPTAGQIWTSYAMLHVYAPDPSADGAYRVRSYPVGGSGSTSITFPVGGPPGEQSLNQVSFAIVPTSGSDGFGRGMGILKKLDLARKEPKGVDTLLDNPFYKVQLHTSSPVRSASSDRQKQPFGSEVEACHGALVESLRQQDYDPAARADYARRQAEMERHIAKLTDTPALLAEIGDARVRKFLEDQLARRQADPARQTGQQPDIQ